MADEKMPAPMPIPVRIDPVRATGVAAIGDENGVVLLFNRPVFVPSPDGKTMSSETVASAAVVIPWVLVSSMRDVLNEQIEKHSSIIAGQDQPQAQPRMN